MGSICCCFRICKQTEKTPTAFKYHSDNNKFNSPLSPTVTCDLFLVVAIYDFTKCHVDDLSFARGDRMCILDNEHDNWWRARHSETGEVGMIPCTYVRRLEPYPENHEAWCVVNRREAINLLNHAEIGTFLIRPYLKPDAYCALSLRTESQATCTPIIKHMKIFTESDGQFRFCAKCCDSNFFKLIERHKNPVTCDCGVVLRKHIIDKPTTIPRQWMIQRDSLILERKLGEGFFGEVWFGKMESTEVAIKRLKCHGASNTNLMKEFVDEAKRLSLIKHRHIVQLLGVCLDNGPLMIVMEYVPLGSLNRFLAQDAGNNITFNNLSIMMGMVADGMDYISTELNIVHRDLRAANILVEKSYSVKIADFGLARDAEYIPSNFQLPIRWTAPEAFTVDGHSTKADVWSYGVLVYEMLTYGSIPYADMSKSEVRERVMEGYRLENPHGRRIYGGNNTVECPDTVYATMMECWNVIPAHRPTFAFLSSFFSDTIGMLDKQYQSADTIC